MSKKFISPEKAPEGIERELLTILIEECAEVQQRATKALRFGLNEVQEGQTLNNIERMSEEIGDLETTINYLGNYSLIDRQALKDGAMHKTRKVFTKLIFYYITDNQRIKINDFLKDRKDYEGAIGGAVTYSFTPTNLGTVVKVTYKDTTIDITEYEHW